MKKIYVCILSLLSVAWTWTADFESGTPGSVANGTSGFTTYAGSATTYSTARAHTGNQSARMVWPSGSEGWGKCHGELTFPSHVTNGEEIWSRGYFYFDDPWNWNNGGAASFIKVMRIHMYNAAGSNIGYHSFFSHWNGNVVASNEPDQYQPTLSATYDTGQWQCIELYIKLSTTDPIVRMWKNGVLIYEDKSHNTMQNSTDYAWRLLVMTQWNNGAPQNQTQYVDDFHVTNERPSKQDAAGNYMIGPTDPDTASPSTGSLRSGVSASGVTFR